MSEQPARKNISLDVVSNYSRAQQLRRDGLSSAPTLAQISHVNRGIRPDLPEDRRALEQKVIDAMRTVYDPELPVNIYDLGLVYTIDIDPENRVKVRMTLTAPGCPVAGTLPPMVESVIENIPEVKSAQVELVWDPQWARDMMSEAAALELGL